MSLPTQMRTLAAPPLWIQEVQYDLRKQIGAEPQVSRCPLSSHSRLAKWLAAESASIAKADFRGPYSAPSYPQNQTKGTRSQVRLVCHPHIRLVRQTQAPTRVKNRLPRGYSLKITCAASSPKRCPHTAKEKTNGRLKTHTTVYMISEKQEMINEENETQNLPLNTISRGILLDIT